MKKKLQKPIDPEELNGYLTYMDYFATGEGRTIEINFCYAATPEEAKDKHRERFYPGDMDAWCYFGIGVEVYPIDSEKAKELIGNVFRFGEQLYKDLVEAGIEFHFKCHCNYS